MNEWAINSYFCPLFHSFPIYLIDMKKLSPVVFILMLSCITGATFSQSKLPIKLGLQVAPNIGWMNPSTKGYSSDGARFGGTIGFVGDFYFAENYAVSTGMNFQFMNGKLTYADLASLAAFGQDTVVNVNVTRKYNFLYIEIPLMIKMKTKTFGKISYFGQIGFGTGFRMKSTFNEHIEPIAGGTPVDQQYDSKQNTTLIRESLLFGIGCEYHIDESSRILIGISYSNSLNNVLKDNNLLTGLPIKSMLNYAELNIGFLF